MNTGIVRPNRTGQDVLIYSKYLVIYFIGLKEEEEISLPQLIEIILFKKRPAHTHKNIHSKILVYLTITINKILLLLRSTFFRF